MENDRFIKLAEYTLLGGALLVIPLLGLAYDDKTTHPALTQEIIKLFNQHFQNLSIPDKEGELIIRGSIDEDSGTRWMRHFYDPVYNRGLVLGKEWMSSKEWAQNTKAQTGFADSALAGTLKSFFGGEDDYSWERAIYDYVWGDKERALKALGHILHLLEDATVPDHTRNDPHPPVLDLGSPYEGWTKKFNRTNNNLEFSELLVILPDLNSYFDKLATYSNSNFFSKDTLLDKIYQNPKVAFFQTERLSNGISYSFAYANGGHRLFRADKILSWRDLIKEDEQKFYLQDHDNLILTDYWSLLSKQAVLHGAGVIKLFFDEVEKEKQTKALYEKNRSWIGKQIDKVKNYAFQAASVLYGISVTQKDLEEEFSTSSNDKSVEVGSRPVGTPSEVRPPLAPPTTETAAVAAAITSEVEPQPQAPPEVQPQTPETTAPPPPPFGATPIEVPLIGAGGAAPPPPPPLPPPPPPTPPPDTTPPDISFVISECNQSLSPNGCLVATTTITLEWSTNANDLGYYEITINGSTSTTTSTSTAVTLTDNSLHTFSARAKDIAGNWSVVETKTAEIITRPVVINEVAWMGTSADRSNDEWVELYNPTSKTIDLSQMKLESLTDSKPKVNLTGTLAAGAYYLIESQDDTTVSDLTASTTNNFWQGGGAGVGIANSGEVLTIEYKGAILDKTPEVGVCGGWCGGAGNPQYWTMERYNPFASGEDANNWSSWPGFLGNGKNADNLPINGTPGKRNSLSYLITKDNTALTQNKTLKKSWSPYLVTTDYIINSGVTLTMEPGTAIKFSGTGAALTVQGTIKAEGTATDKVIFTSLKDDSYAGDTNQDGATTTPQAGDWGTIKILGNGSSFDQTLIRYGGWKDPLGALWANLRIENVSFTLRNSTVEEAGGYGAKLINASGAIDLNTFRGNNHDTAAVGLFVSDGSLAISGNTFTENSAGLKINTLGSSHTISVTGNTFTQNSNAAIEVINAYPTFSGNATSSNGTNGIVMTGNLTQDYTLSPNLPYVVSTDFQVPSGKTLTISPGTVIKLSGSGMFNVSGKLLAQGSADSKVVFTSLLDDTYGGDTNNNGASTTPEAGDWLNLYFGAGSGSSTLTHAIIRYGGTKAVLDPNKGALRIENSSLDLANLTVEKNYHTGIWLRNSTTTAITSSVIQEHQEPDPAYGLDLINSSPSIQDTVFENNLVGIRADDSSSVLDGGGIEFNNNDTYTIPEDLIP